MIKNWRPISLSNLDYKIISKVFADHLKGVLSDLISSQQAAYVAKRLTGESDRLISDILDAFKKFNVSRYLVTSDIKKAVGSLDHNLLITVTDKFGFKSYFTY